MKIRPLTVPRLKHKQRFNRGQVNRFFQDVQKWIKAANKRIAEMKYDRRNYYEERLVRLENGLSQIKDHLEFLHDRGFRDHNVERDLANIEKRLRDI